MSALDLIRPDLASIQTYSVMKDALDCQMHANELPWCPLTVKNLELNRYPATTPINQLQIQLASCYQVKPEQLLITRGSDEGIDLLMRLFLRAGIDRVMQCPPTFPMYVFYARIQQAGVIDCPLQENAASFNLDVDKMNASWRPSCKLIMLCRPNNPTGELIELTTIAKLCEQYRDQSIIVVDEAYIEFSEAESAITLIPQFDNLIVLRTLSKAYGLAGLRLGSVIAQSPVIQAMKKIIAPFSLSSVVIDLGLRALENKAWFASRWECIKLLRAQLATDLQQSPWINNVYPSAANFILVKTRYAHALTDWLKQQHIAVRSFADSALLPEHLRITVGNDYQNKQLITALNLFSGEA